MDLRCTDLQGEENHERSVDDNFELHKESAFTEEKPQISQLSRLCSEFEELELLGEGGYGSVIKVRNKLDRCLYAIKRIKLDPESSDRNGKIIREVKVLSNLTHENIVRYYNAWTEITEGNQENLPDNSSSNPTSELTPSETNSTRSKNSLGLQDDIEKLAFPPISSKSSEPMVFVEDIILNEDIDDGDDDGGVFKTTYNAGMSTMFDDAEEEENDDEENEEEDEEEEEENEEGDDDEEENDAEEDEVVMSTTESTDTSNSSASVIQQRILYIQMQYCENGTLRQTIDEGLYTNTDRRWRLFREILEGLCHVHGKKMIHRDLTPRNIFLDRQDHVKIGDFGLAYGELGSGGSSEDSNLQPDRVDNRLTAEVGTPLYTAPELQVSAERTVYSCEIDIYSMGIIFFEMCHRPIFTEMERVKVINNLRNPSISFPSDFDEGSMKHETSIIRWCLDHQPSNRPTAMQLLKCQWVPTPVSEESRALEEARQMLVDVLVDLHTNHYRFIAKEAFNQPVNTSTPVSYDFEVCCKKKFSLANGIIQQHTQEGVSNILQRHGAVQMDIALLLSKQEKLTQKAETTVFMDITGTMVVLPDNLRIPFARYVACRGITSIKRYAIDKVYKTYKTGKIRMPRQKEFWECSFDIVTPPNLAREASLIPDAEVISAVSEIISAFPNLASRKYVIRINHMMVLKSILTHCGLPDEEHYNALNALAACDMRQASNRLRRLPLNRKQMASLIKFKEVKACLYNVRKALLPITRKKRSGIGEEVASQARQGLREMEKLRRNLRFLDINLPVTFDLGLCHKYHQHYNGVIFQVLSVMRKKEGLVEVDVLANGGRYDKLIQDINFLTVPSSGKKETDNGSPPMCRAVGVIIAIEKVVNAEVANLTPDSSRRTSLTDTSSLTPQSASCAAVEVLVYSIGRSDMLKKRLKLVKSLWSASIAAETPYDKNRALSLQEAQKIALRRGVRHFVELNDRESGLATVKSFMHGASINAQECKLPLKQVVGHLSRQLRGTEEGSSISANVNTSFAMRSSAASLRGSIASHACSHGGTCHLSIEIVPPNELPINDTKKLKDVIRNKILSLPIMVNISVKTPKCVVAVDLPSSLMKLFACSLVVSHGVDEFKSSSAQQLEWASEYREYMSSICEKIAEVKFSRKIVFVFLYSYNDAGYYMLV